MDAFSSSNNWECLISLGGWEICPWHLEILSSLIFLLFETLELEDESKEEYIKFSSLMSYSKALLSERFCSVSLHCCLLTRAIY
ncbi:hypothetical protein V6N13_049547 [Hibiscus sabdariffa]